MNVPDLFDLPWGPLLIFGLRVADVSLDTMRVLFAVRGKRYHAASLGFFQALIFILVVGNVIQHLGSIWHVLGYAGGFATGTLVGVQIENAVAYGLSTVRIVSPHGGVEIANALRERGYGATEVAGYGRDGTVEIVDSVVHRSHLDDVMEIVDKWDSQAFVTVEEPKILRGGSLADRARWMRVPQWARFRYKDRPRV
jgi:uncharacterized protein YebE (UPF0316 family)